MIRVIRRAVAYLSLLAVVITGSSLHAGSGCPTCGKPCDHQPTVMRKQVMVPHWEKQRRVIQVTKMVPERREHRYIAHRTIPEVVQVEKEFVVTVPVVRHKQVREVVHVPTYREVAQPYVDYKPVYRDVAHRYVVQVPRWENVEEQVMVPVPHVEQRHGVKTVCRMVRDVAVREVCRDEGQWVNQQKQVVCGSACGGCGKAHYVNCRVWVPNIVRRQVEVPIMRPEMVEVPYDNNVTVMRSEPRVVVRRVCHYEPQEKVVMQRVCDYQPVNRVRMVRVCEMQARERMRDVSYVECEQRREVRMVNETNYRVIEEEKVDYYTVCVPRNFEQEIEVDVCRMVPREIEVPVSCGHCNDCGPPPAPVFARRGFRCRGC